MDKTNKTSQDKSIVAQIAVYAASATVSVLSIWTTVRDSFYRHISRSTKWYEKIRNERTYKFEAIEKISGEAYQKEHKAISAAYSDAVSKINIEKGFTGTWQKFKFLNKNEKMKVAGIAVTVGAITMGAVTNIRQNHQIKHQLEEMNRENETGASAGIR